jgi:hypothetical protein
MMGQCGSSNLQFRLDFIDDHSIRMRSQKQPNDLQARFRTKSRKNIGVSCDSLRFLLFRARTHIL